MKNVLIVEDDDRIAQNISKGLKEKGFHTEIAINGTEGVALGLQEKFDLILLDLNLPELNGFEVTEKIRKDGVNTPILMLTAWGETDDKVAGFEKGADDYLVKPFDFRELLARINALLKRSFPKENQSDILEVADLKVDLDAKLVFRGDKVIQLTPKELKLLVFLIQNKGKVLSKTEIAEAIWEQNPGKSLNVIEVYINFLRKKIDKDFDRKLIKTKSGMGYVIRDES